MYYLFTRKCGKNISQRTSHILFSKGSIYPLSLLMVFCTHTLTQARGAGFPWGEPFLFLTEEAEVREMTS